MPLLKRAPRSHEAFLGLLLFMFYISFLLVGFYVFGPPPEFPGFPASPFDEVPLATKEFELLYVDQLSSCPSITCKSSTVISEFRYTTGRTAKPSANQRPYEAPARRMAFPKDGSQMVLLIEAARGCGARPLVIGNGTNLLFPDEGVDRLVVNTRDMSCVVLDAEGRVTAEAGVPLARAAVFAQKQGLTGLEFAHGIPGSVGGAVCMNAGAYGGEMQQVVHSATVLFPDDGVRTLRGEELRFSYRHSLLTDRPEAVVLRVVFQLTAGRPEEIRQKMEELMARRKTSQPLEYPSAGSTFKRPEGYFAAALIDQCGLKGMTVGGAQVSEKHAGFVINRGGATCADVTALMAVIQRRVWEEKGVRLEPEIKMIH